VTKIVKYCDESALALPVQGQPFMHHNRWKDIRNKKVQNMVWGYLMQEKHVGEH